MEEFKKKYKEEATDLINELEKNLLVLENNPNDKNLIGQVFRTMHSLKGGGAMFGYDKVSSFTHELESIYDLIRNNKISITEELLSITLLSVDHLKKLFEEDTYSEETLAQDKKLSNQIKSILTNSAENPEDISVSVGEDDHLEEKRTYHILFSPYEEIFNNGTNPLYLLDELATMGNAMVIPISTKIPNLNLLEPEKCFFSWEIYLVTAESSNAIKDIFIFVEDECEIIVSQMSETDLLADETFLKEIKDKFSGEFSFLRKKKTKKETTKLEKQSTKTDNKKTSKKRVVKNASQKKTRQKVIEKSVSGFAPQKQQVPKENIISSVRVSSEKVDALMNLVSELVTTQASLSLYADERQLPGLVGISENVENISRQLRDIAFNISLIPLETLLTRFQRLVRDLSTELKKKVNFKAEGIDTELDKNLIQAISEPLMHIIRNSIDHGIEYKEERIKAGKPITGEILLKAFYSGANVIIQIIDDGRGIDREIIRQKAINKGLISEDVNLTDKELFNYIFLSGFSTATEITGVSGRGVGMDVVKRKISEIRGEVDIHTEQGKGTTMTIKLPLTLSIIDGLLVKIDDTSFLIPLSAVNKIYPIEHKKVVASFNNIVVLNDEQIPFHFLSEEFNLTKTENEIDEVVVEAERHDEPDKH